ncbi:hypothetical protein GCM10010123_42450 [Pilimelia anulata]|uniref:Uncharacterized protein n=1 Tax=Pilimelia anulata TaxID=53371 RepID=A0A8J3FCC5_9ACTN|nr:hypothetical protein GCM10010123_42450 [Pilimelia anulata]
MRARSIRFRTGAAVLCAPRRERDRERPRGRRAGRRGAPALNRFRDGQLGCRTATAGKGASRRRSADGLIVANVDSDGAGNRRWPLRGTPSIRAGAGQGRRGSARAPRSDNRTMGGALFTRRPVNGVHRMVISPVSAAFPQANTCHQHVARADVH